MSERVNCSKCDGAGYVDALISQHDDKKETTKCTKCDGKGYINQMSDDDERDYHDNYW